jgi:hypothetical protein
MQAYNLLSAQRRRGESFSKLVKRRLRPARTGAALLDGLAKVALSEDALDRVDELIKARAESPAASPIMSLKG